MSAAMQRLGEPRRRGGKRWLALAAVLAVGVGLFVTLRTGGEPRVELSADRPGLGPTTTLAVIAEEPKRGLVRLELELEQGGTTWPLLDRDYVPRPVWDLRGPRTASDRAEVVVDRASLDGLEAGTATLRARVRRAGTWLLHPEPTVAELELPVKLRPPLLQVLSTQHYPSVGGAEAVVYRAGGGEPASVDGVVAGDRFFPGYDLPGGSGERFALFAVPHDLDDPTAVRLVAEDELGNRAERSFVDRLLPTAFRSDRVEVSDGFIERVAAEIEGQTPSLDGSGGPADRYLAINRDLRAANRRRIAELAERSPPEFRWREVFLAMPAAQVMAGFGDRRTYLYGGEEIDRQDHLGIDLASTSHAPVPAANDGVVVLAGYLGIYGNVVVLDHGHGLLTLYAHLSAVDVAEGDAVARGEVVGRTGATGLAGGDHLHYGVFLHGTAVDPEEWWDAKWIGDRLGRKLGDALPFQADR